MKPPFDSIICTRGFGLAVVLGLAACAPFGNVCAQGWDTVDDYSPYAMASGSTVDAADNLFVAGAMRDGFSAPWHAIIMKSADGGDTWDSDPSTPEVADPSDDFTSIDGAKPRYYAVAAARVPDGTGGLADHVVAFGHGSRLPAAPFEAFDTNWFVRRSVDGGATWQTIDEYEHPAYQIRANANAAVAIDRLGNIYVTGPAIEWNSIKKGKTTTTTKVNHWLIRKGVSNWDGTVIWQTVDLPFPSSETNRVNVFPSGVACIGSDVYVVGGGGSDGGDWIVLKSSDGGATWGAVDTFRLDPSNRSHAYGIAADTTNGSLLVVGSGLRTVTSGRGKTATTTTEQFWLVRQAAPGGTAWITIDAFSASGGIAEPRSVTVDAERRVHVTGTFTPDTGAMQWLTREGIAGTWITSDLFAYSSDGHTAGTSICADLVGNAFATGWASDSTGAIQNWLVRRKPAP